MEILGDNTAKDVILQIDVGPRSAWAPMWSRS
jgi:hypothetical protein